MFKAHRFNILYMGIAGSLLLIAIPIVLIAISFFAFMIYNIVTPAPIPGCYPQCSSVDLTEEGLFRTNLKGGDFTNANLSEITLYGTNLEGADLTNANLSWSNLARANLQGANLTNATLIGTSFANADLSGANLKGVDLTAARLTTTNLAGANLNEAMLKEGKYYDGKTNELKRVVKVNLNGADLTNVNLRGADLSGANLSKANLRGATYDDKTVWPEGFDPIKAETVYENK